METTTDILNELTSISPLIAGMNKVNVFTVPQGYFESIGNTVLACLMEGHETVYPKKITQYPDIPKGYFDHLADSILDKIKATETAADEIRNLSPLLYGIQNNEIFEVPDGYFAHISDNILNKVKPQSNKVISMRRQNVFIKYAVAAMMAGVIALGLYKYIDKPRSGSGNSSTVATLDSTIEKGRNMNDQQFNEALGNLTETDIAKYLEKNGDITDVAVLKNNLDESNLPSQEDYLLDETTLEKYLNKIEKTTLNN